jgi:hypothetical protein
LIIWLLPVAVVAVMDAAPVAALVVIEQLVVLLFLLGLQLQ